MAQLTYAEYLLNDPVWKMEIAVSQQFDKILEACGFESYLTNWGSGGGCEYWRNIEKGLYIRIGYSSARACPVSVEFLGENKL